MAHKASLAGGSAKFPNPHSTNLTRFRQQLKIVHKSVVHAPESYKPSPPPKPARPRTRKALAPPAHAQECCACTRVLCMHKSVVQSTLPPIA